MKQDRRSDITECIELAVSFKTRVSKQSSDSELCPPPTIPLKQRVTIGGTDTSKELQSFLRRRGSSDGVNFGDNSFPRISTPMSPQRVSKIFFRDVEKNLVGAGRSNSRRSLFHDDMQALFDAHELMSGDGDPQRRRTSRTLRVGINDATYVRVSLIDGKKCTFGGVEIREYPIIPGDSPAGYKGPPLTIGWQPVTTVRIAHIDKYEEVREGHRRSQKELSIDVNQRMEILRNQGFARSEIQKSIKEANVARRQRRETMLTLKYEAAYEKLESIQRKAMNILTFGKKNRATKEYLKKYVSTYGVVQ